MNRRCCRSVTLMGWKSRLPGYLPAASSVHYTTSCKHSLVLLMIGAIIGRNMLSWLELLINRYCCNWSVVYIITLDLYGLPVMNTLTSFITKYNQEDATLHCIYCIGYPMLYIRFRAPEDGQRNRLKHVENFTEINKLCNVASCWLHLKRSLRGTDPWISDFDFSKCMTSLRFFLHATLCYFLSTPKF